MRAWGDCVIVADDVARSAEDDTSLLQIDCSIVLSAGAKGP